MSAMRFTPMPSERISHKTSPLTIPPSTSRTTSRRISWPLHGGASTTGTPPTIVTPTTLPGPGSQATPSKTAAHPVIANPARIIATDSREQTQTHNRIRQLHDPPTTQRSFHNRTNPFWQTTERYRCRTVAQILGRTSPTDQRAAPHITRRRRTARTTPSWTSDVRASPGGGTC